MNKTIFRVEWLHESAGWIIFAEYEDGKISINKAKQLSGEEGGRKTRVIKVEETNVGEFYDED